MRGMWLFCLCVVLASPTVLVIDNFEGEKNWETMKAQGALLTVFPDHVDVKEGQTSLRLEATFSGDCAQAERCFAGITLTAPNLADYAFLRLWLKVDQPSDDIFGILVETDKNFFYAVPLDKAGWKVVTAPFSEFASEGEELKGVDPADITSVGLFIIGAKAGTIKVNVDGFTALTDTNGNGIPDVEEETLAEAAKNSEEMANRYFGQGDYEKAARYYSEAMSLFSQLGNQEKASEMDAKMKESQAWQNYQQAEDLYGQGQYEKAMEAYERSRRTFVLLGNAEMVDKIEERLKEIREKTGLTPSPRPGTGTYERPEKARGGVGGLLFVLLIVCIVGVGVYLWKFRKPGEKVEEKKKAVSSPADKSEEIRELKARFVYGEIGKAEYEKKLKELEGKP